MSIIEAVLLAILEGLTEFIPVSSTAHLMVGSALMDIPSTPFVKFYTVCVQLGAILSVMVVYYRRFFKSLDFYFKLLIAFIPAAIAGILLGDMIDAALENLWGVTLFLVLGGLVFLKSDTWFRNNHIQDEEALRYRDALKIGLIQCLALFPGVSRSGATILGARAIGCSVKFSAEFSFFLAVPTMFGATAKKSFDLWKENWSPVNEEIWILLVGNLVSFIVAWLSVRTFVGMLQKWGFKPFGYYRIALGLILLVLFALGFKTTLH